MIDIKGFSERLINAMDSAGLSAAQLAEVAGVNRGTVNRYCNWSYTYRKWDSIAVPVPNIELLRRMAECLGVSVRWLVSGEGREVWIRELN